LHQSRIYLSISKEEINIDSTKWIFQRDNNYYLRTTVYTFLWIHFIATNIRIFISSQILCESLKEEHTRPFWRCVSCLIAIACYARKGPIISGLNRLWISYARCSACKCVYVCCVFFVCVSCSNDQTMSRSRGGGRDRSEELRRTYTEFSLSLGSPRARLRRRLLSSNNDVLYLARLSLVHPYRLSSVIPRLCLPPSLATHPSHLSLRYYTSEYARMAASLSA